MATTAKKCHNEGEGGVGKVVAHDQLSHLVINKINHVAMVTTSKNPKWRPSAQFLDFIYFFINFLKQLKLITNMKFQSFFQAEHQFLKASIEFRDFL